MGHNLQPYEKLNHSQEILLGQIPTVFRLNIWLVVLAIIAALFWITFGEMEEVIRTSGVIRPQQNISSVHSVVSGNVLGIYFQPGMLVHTGDLLLEIDSKVLNAELESLKTQQERYLNRLEGLNYIAASLFQKANLIPTTHQEAHSRYSSYSLQKQLLGFRLEEIKRRWEQEKSLLPNATTLSAVLELETQVKMADIDYQKLESDFGYEIQTEKKSIEVEIIRLQSQISDVQQRISLCRVIAPVSGRIQIRSSLNSGDFLSSGQEILRIIPEQSETLRIELMVASSMAGKILEGMEVEIRFPSLPFHEFGGLTGVIETLSPDVSVRESGQAFFTLYSSIPDHYLLDRHGREYPLKVGLQVDGRIILKKRPIWKFILEKLDFLMD